MTPARDDLRIPGTHNHPGDHYRKVSNEQLTAMLPSIIDAVGPQAVMDALDIPADRQNPWHVVTIGLDVWDIAHPVTCRLADCEFWAQARRWTTSPASPGIYRWHTVDQTLEFETEQSDD